MSLPQLIQTVSAVDQDDPRNGQHFYYSLAPEAANNPNFTLRDNQGNPLAADASPQRGGDTVGCYTMHTVGGHWLLNVNSMEGTNAHLYDPFKVLFQNIKDKKRPLLILKLLRS